LQVYCAILSQGLQIPRNISVVGSDDFQAVSRGLRPQLTAAALPYFQMGYEGAALLETLLGGGTAAGVSAMDCESVDRHRAALDRLDRKALHQFARLTVERSGRHIARQHA
jgi:LacI family transcriptional regulator